MAKFRWKHIFSARARAIRSADIARDSGAARKASALYQKIIDRWGSDFSILIQLGNALKDSGNYSDAEHIYLEALAIRPEDADAYVQRGHLMKLSGNLGLAVTYYRHANQLDPSLATARSELELLSPSGVGLRTDEDCADIEQRTLRSDIPITAGVILHRITNEYRWRRG